LTGWAEIEDELIIDGKLDEIGCRLQMKDCHDLILMKCDCAGLESQLGRRLFHRMSFGQQLNHLPLSRAEASA
jgi:hypothetical protein